MAGVGVIAVAGDQLITVGSGCLTVEDDVMMPTMDDPGCESIVYVLLDVEMWPKM